MEFRAVLRTVLLTLMLTVSPSLADGVSVPGLVQSVNSNAALSYPPKSSGGGGGTPPTLDGTPPAPTNFLSATTAALSVTTTGANEQITVAVGFETQVTTHVTLSSVTATGLTFTKRSTIYADNVVNGPFGATSNSLEVWSAPVPVAATYAIAITSSGNVDCGMVTGFATKIDGTNTPAWTSNSPLTNNSTSATPSVPTVSSVASNKAALLWGFAVNAGSTNQTAGAGFTLPANLTGNNGGCAVSIAIGDQFKSFSSSTSGQTVAFGTSWQTWIMIADAMEGL